MAESKRRGEDAVDGHLDEVLDDAVDDDSLDDEDASAAARKATAVRTKSKDDGDKTDKKAVRGASDDRPGIFGRIGRFIREIVAELRKVIWPTRKELLTYATVVVVFVAIMLTIVGLLDLGFAKAVLFVFGNGQK
ncbi:MAG TPA: preprotein translocase subunit SecE [Rugosimonospora sp.]